MAESGDDLLARVTERIERINRWQAELMAAAEAKGDSYVDPKGLLELHTKSIGELVHITGMLAAEVARLRHED